MKIIFGLGNPGAQYAHNRHNVGFMVLDRIAHEAGARFTRNLKIKGHSARIEEGADSLLLVKPSTFMNNSGVCVRRAMDVFGAKQNELLVVYDDMSLPLGSMRLREKGRSGGHNGMASVIELAGGECINRLRVGIDAAPEKDATGHVLSDFLPEERAVLKECVEKAVSACRDWATHGSKYAMNKYNT